VSLWTDVIAYSSTWVDVYPAMVERFIAELSQSKDRLPVVRIHEPELVCYGMFDLDGEARKRAKNPDLDSLMKRLIAQAARAEEIDSEATGEYEPPSWTEAGDTHIGPFLSVDGSLAKVRGQLAKATELPFSELELLGLRPGDEIVKQLAQCDGESYLAFSEINLEVGPNLSKFLDDPPEFAGWLRVSLSGEGQPYPLTRDELIAKAKACKPLGKVIGCASRCFNVSTWSWAVSCSA
jgi:hypothetical protein